MTILLKWTYDLSYRLSKANWERDAIPPQIASLVEMSQAGGRALDLGCGSGTYAIYLAQHGLDVVGIDYSKKAIELAQLKAKKAGVAIDFRLADVTRLDFLNGPFDLFLDVGCLHGLNASECRRYAAQLANISRPGSRFLLWAFDESAYTGIGLTPEITLAYFTPPFSLERTERDRFHQRTALWYWFTR